MTANLAIHSHSSLTLSGPSLRVRRLLRLFRHSLDFNRPQAARRWAGFCQWD
jgi:hypothetical protein